MKKYIHPKSSTFLIELMINILIFLFIVTICLRFFIKSHNISEKTIELQHAINICSNVSNIYQSGEPELILLKSEFPEATYMKDCVIIYYDDNYKPSDEKNAKFCCIIKETSKDKHLSIVNINFNSAKSKEVIYSTISSNYKQLYISEGGIQ